MTNWLYEILMAFSGMFILFSIMSLVNLFYLGPKKYLLQMRVLFGFKVDKSFYKKTTLSIQSGGRHYKTIDDKYYFFVNIKSGTQVILFRSSEGFLSYPTIHYINKIDNEWKYEELRISNNSCLFTQILKEIVCKKMNKHTGDATLLENDGDLDGFINNHLVQMVRDNKLNTILK